MSPDPNTPHAPDGPNANDNEQEGPTTRTYVLLGVGVAAALLLAWFALEFAEWNKLQACALSGRKNCAPATSTTR